ncbi:unnamed protein product [Fraxinus pennsylvanica]|uniref:Uncharacterized protein n=1 Tax=Fraxinus pennsylvanica TaxID=56036 RepID=A0AAD1YLN1_9LAMI|nr:unnamed protein product [Fraxinus pennsylvanica]
MEAILIHPSTDQSLSPYKSHIRNYKKIKPQFISATSDCGIKPCFLPLPISNSRNNSTVSRRGVGVPPQKGGLSDHARTTVYQKQRDVNRKTKYNGTRDQNPSHNFKKSKQTTNSSTSQLENQVDKFSGSVVAILSPPPSSLPLPTFSLRPKLSCNAEAAGVDIGATNNLRRLLRLQ